MTLLSTRTGTTVTFNTKKPKRTKRHDTKKDYPPFVDNDKYHHVV